MRFLSFVKLFIYQKQFYHKYIVFSRHFKIKRKSHPLIISEKRRVKNGKSRLR
jgi:hypothetical protein